MNNISKNNVQGDANITGHLEKIQDLIISVKYFQTIKVLRVHQKKTCEYAHRLHCVTSLLI